MSNEITLEGNPHLYPETDTYRTWMYAIRGDWERFKKVANTCVDHATFHAANQTLGYNLAKACPCLILELEARQGHYAHLAENLRDAEKELDCANATVTALKRVIADLRGPLARAWWED